MSLSLKTHLFSLSGFHYNSFDHFCYSWCITRRLTSTPSLSTTQEITTYPDSLTLNQSITSTEVSKLPITLRKGGLFCTQHHIAKVLSFSHLSPIYFSFATILSSISLLKSHCDAMLDPKWKSVMDEEMTALRANET